LFGNWGDVGMSDWQIVSLESVAKIERDGINPSDIVSGTAYVGLENIESGGAFFNVRDVDSGELASNKFLFTEQHVLYGKLRPYLAKIARPEFRGICSTDILPILPSKNLDRDYLTHFLRQPSMIDLATARSAGANLPRLSPKVLAEFQIPLPPIATQKHIAAILDQAEALRSARQKAIGLLDELARSVFLEMFGDPLKNSKGWKENQTLGEISDIASGITKGRKLNEKSTREIPYLAVLNVQDRRLNLDVIKTIEATDDEINRWRLQKDDLLLTEGGDPDKLGRGTLWSDEVPECIHQNHVFRVRLNTNSIHPLFLNWIVGSQKGKDYFLKSAKQTTGIASINMTQLRGFPMLSPPPALQQEFADRIGAIEALKTTHRESLTKLDELFASLQHRAFRGEL
jgi:type I restriction enzyme, S subunit